MKDQPIVAPCKGVRIFQGRSFIELVPWELRDVWMHAMLVLEQHRPLHPNVQRQRLGEGAQTADPVIAPVDTEGLDHAANPNVADCVNDQRHPFAPRRHEGHEVVYLSLTPIALPVVSGAGKLMNPPEPPRNLPRPRLFAQE